MKFNQKDHLNTWKSNVGLLPQKLFSTEKFNDEYYILLNGRLGNFCLDLSNLSVEETVYHSYAWSANTKNYAVVKDDQVVIHNWAQKDKEKIPLNLVQDNQLKFYKYLSTRNLFTEHDLLPTVLRTFNSIRILTQENTDPIAALSLILTLLVRSEDPAKKINQNEWIIPDATTPPGFDKYIENFSSGNRRISPNIEIILKHSASAIFQDIHYVIENYSAQSDLFRTGHFPSKLQRRNKLAVITKPASLVRALVEISLNNCVDFDSNISVLDPFCGSGEFLVEVLKQLRERGFSGSIKIQGYSESDINVVTAKFLLHIEKRDYWKERLDFRIEKNDNALTLNWGKQDLILTSPPNISWDSLDQEQKDISKQILGRINQSKPNEASVYLFKAIESLSDRGVVGCIIPSSLTYTDSYSEFRREINESINLYLIGNLGSKVFPFSLSDVSILVGGKVAKNQDIVKIWNDNSSGNSDEILREFRIFTEKNKTIVDLKNFNIYREIVVDKPVWKCSSLADSSLARTLHGRIDQQMLVCLSKIFDVKLGIRTGANDIFKIPANEYSLLPKSEQKYFRPVVETISIKNCRIDPVNYLWYPYSSKGDPLFKDETELRKKVPSYFDQLCSEIKRLKRRSKTVKNWWDLSDKAPRLLNPGTILVSGEYGNNSSFALLRENAFVIERGYGWSIKDPKQGEDLYYFYLTIFSSNFFNRLLSIYARRIYGEDIFDLGRSYVANIPIPNPQYFYYSIREEFNEDIIRKYSMIGRKLSDSELVMDQNIDDQIQSELYGL